MNYIGEIALILFTTLLAGAISQRFKMPMVIGELLIGVILGPGVLHLISDGELMTAGSEIGVIILMFLAGIESDLTQLKKYFRPALLVAGLGVILPMVVFYYLGMLNHQGFERSIFWGVIFSATSVSISVEVLREFKYLSTKEGATILGAAVVDDIIAVILVSIFTSTFGVGNESANLVVTSLIQVIYFVGVVVLVKWLAPWLLHFAERVPVPGAVAITSLSLCLAMAWLADTVGLSAVVGAFFAGVAVGQTKYQHEVVQNVGPVGNTFFIPIFFVSIGMAMEFDGIGRHIGFIVIMTVAALLTKYLGGALGAKLAGDNWHSASLIGTGMISRGEMALIIAQLGISAHLLQRELYSELIIVIVLTTILAPLMLKWAINQIKKREDELP
ncbi:cation:proton antiporter [Lentilactobacillus senioris]|uniref:Na+ H+ antiporter n=1 Tax=Lentilactobacillus senioris DSM 24302 = JCM 17472 TaxID=1423802 RepID=A0A0R2CZF5_9LACO|nr:cation:proton antiporter [Lentilactobacillus senioris]KRM93206.1 Na+ H+ antiporter [Lentilactobacillus senioris DSM 24302 = JCM 17472]